MKNKFQKEFLKTLVSEEEGGPHRNQTITPFAQRHMKAFNNADFNNRDELREKTLNVLISLTGIQGLNMFSDNEVKQTVEHINDLINPGQLSAVMGESVDDESVDGDDGDGVHDPHPDQSTPTYSQSNNNIGTDTNPNPMNELMSTIMPMIEPIKNIFNQVQTYVNEDFLTNTVRDVNNIIDSNMDNEDVKEFHDKCMSLKESKGEEIKDELTSLLDEVDDLANQLKDHQRKGQQKAEESKLNSYKNFHNYKKLNEAIEWPVYFGGDRRGRDREIERNRFDPRDALSPVVARGVEKIRDDVIGRSGFWATIGALLIGIVIGYMGLVIIANILKELLKLGPKIITQLIFPVGGFTGRIIQVGQEAIDPAKDIIQIIEWVWRVVTSGPIERMVANIANMVPGVGPRRFWNRKRFRAV